MSYIRSRKPVVYHLAQRKNTNLIAVLVRQFNEPAIPGARKTPRQELPRPPKPLPPARLHDLRHVHATMLLTAGVHPALVAC
jgi:integrase